ncbi:MULTISPECIES: EspA/EspE family type VII secretion system effector [Mycolicibacterium]|uniref:EspA/EspE family type VII secretion system effector n=1 Tax=Mycolicibacterium TaxID=1866885 RepID=UPI0005A2EB1E|nr:MULTISPECIES: EspA/EspE family type VII secretion system effector [Mycolicibacterium]MBV5245562.1 DUF4226 domain-containing protein [Mycolicibacterium sp. PAM1]
MSVLGSFLTTWSQARAAFGDGVPLPGSTFDGSSTLRRLEAETRRAAPRSDWTGGAADTYAAGNAEHARAFARMAELDERMGREVDRSAVVVRDGRVDLDSVKDWVLSAAASVPDNAAGERMLLPIVGKGCTDIADIVTSSNGQLATIAERIRSLGVEYAALDDAASVTPRSEATTSDLRRPTPRHR